MSSKRSEEILVGAEEVAAFLGWHVNTLRKYANQYPPGGAGFPSHLNGRWNLKKCDALAWRDYVLREDMRHPEARRYRPTEPPEIEAIIGRAPAGPAPRRQPGTPSTASESEMSSTELVKTQ